MIALLALLLSAHATPPLIVKVEPGVEEVELTCSNGKSMRDVVRDGQVSFPVAPDECDVRLLKRSGKTETNGTWKCDDQGCKMERPPHAPISNAPGRINLVLLGDVVGATRAEIKCPGGHRERGSVADNTIVFDGVPDEACDISLKSGTPATAKAVKPGGSYKCTVNPPTLYCSDYAP